MRYPIWMTFVTLCLLSIFNVACPKQVKKPTRQVLSYGKNYKNWSKLTKRKVISSYHGNTEKNIYANDLAQKVFMGIKKMPYPKEATFVVIHYKDGEQQEYAYVMHKMGENYDPDRSNWKYSIVRISDWTIEQSGRIATCIRCHEKAAARDYIRLDRKLFQKNNPF